MEVIEAEAISSDDYEEGEILENDTLYDNVSSLEEFSGSDDVEFVGEYSLDTKKRTTHCSKGKHHRKKEHKCKEDSICRKERSGKHCYARIRKGKTSSLEAVEKSRNLDSIVGHGQDSRKKSHTILSPIHETCTKHYSRRTHVQKDLHEKENRVCHKNYERYYDSHKSGPYRIDKKKFNEKLKKHLTIGNSRSHDSRKRSKSPSPKLLGRVQVKEVAKPKPKSSTSLLKRLVGSGSIGVKMPKDIEEPKKVEINSTDEVKEVSIITSITMQEDELLNEEAILENSDEKCGKNLQVTSDLESLKLADDQIVKMQQTSSVPTEKTSEVNETPSGDTQQIEKLESELSKDSCNNSTNETVNEPSLSVIDNDSVIMITNEGARLSNQTENIEIDAGLSKILSTAGEDHNSEDSVSDLLNDITPKACNSKDLNDSFSNEDTQKIEQNIAEDTDELNLRLEALRTAMLRKHRERKKRGFTCKKKSTIEDDSFAEYILNHTDSKDTSVIANNEEDNDLIGHTDCNSVNTLGDLLNPEDMVIDKNDKSEEDCENNILENFPYPLSNYPVQNSENMSLQYVGYPAYAVYPYPVINESVPFSSIKESTGLYAGTNKNINDYSGYQLPNTQTFDPSLMTNTSLIPLPKENDILQSFDFNEAHSNSKNFKYCLKEINPNKEPSMVRNKRVRKLSTKIKVCRRRELHGKQWHASRAVMKRKLERREYAHQKRKRKESSRDLKLISTVGSINNDESIEESDEEIALRELALKSVKEREKPKDLLESATISETEKSNHSSVSMNTNDGQNFFSNLHIEIDNHHVHSKPLASYDSESTPTNLSNEAWDDIDEDILRAQLLSSLSSKIPEKQLNEHTPLVQISTKKQSKALRKFYDVGIDKRLIKYNTMKVNKENFKNLFRNKTSTTSDMSIRKMEELLHFKKKSKINQAIGVQKKNSEGPVVPKFIISLQDDSSSEGEEAEVDEVTTPFSDDLDKSDVVKSIDLFLQEAQLESTLKQNMNREKLATISSKSQKIDLKSDEVKHLGTADVKLSDNDDNPNTALGASGTPQVLKHLPAWQQEEYRRLKKQIAEKEKVLKAAKEKVVTPVESERLLKESATQIKSTAKCDDENDSCVKTVEELHSLSGETDSIVTSEVSTAIVNEDEVRCTTNNTDLQQLVTDMKSTTIASPSSSSKPIDTSRSLRHPKDSNKIVEHVNHLAKIVAQLEKGVNNYRTLKEDILRKKKEILIAKFNMVRQKKSLFEIKKKIMSEEQLLQAKLAQDLLSPDLTSKTESNDLKKPSVSRDLELCKLRLREFNLRTKMIFDEISQSNIGESKIMKINPKKIVIPFGKSNISMETAKQIISLRNSKLAANSTARQPKLLPASLENMKTIVNNNNNNSSDNTVRNTQSSGPVSVSGKQSENWDPFVPICPFDLTGVCKDEECKFQHIKAT